LIILFSNDIPGSNILLNSPISITERTIFKGIKELKYGKTYGDDEHIPLSQLFRNLHLNTMNLYIAKYSLPRLLYTLPRLLSYRLV
jgi:hypothetical protein